MEVVACGAKLGQTWFQLFTYGIGSNSGFREAKNAEFKQSGVVTEITFTGFRKQRFFGLATHSTHTLMWLPSFKINWKQNRVRLIASFGMEMFPKSVSGTSVKL